MRSNTVNGSLNKDDLFQVLPKDVLKLLLSNFDPVFITKTIFLINTYFYFHVNTNEFWLEKLQLHFPHKLSEYEKKMKPLNSKSIKIDAHAEFIKAYEADYLNLTPEIRNLFSIAKENNALNWSDKQRLMTLKIWNTFDSSGHSLIFWSKKNKHILSYLYQLKKENYSPHQQINTQKIDYMNRTIFYWSIVYDQDLDEINFLRNHGSTFNEIYDNDEQPIHLAVREGRLDLVKMIIKEEEYHLNSINASGETPLMLAVSQGHLEIVEYLIKQPEIDLNKQSRGPHPGMNALHFAAEFGHSDVISVLLKAGMDATIVTKRKVNCYLPLHFAVKSGDVESVDILVRQCPQTIDVPDSKGQTPFLWAVAKGYLALVQYFLNAYVKNKSSINLNVMTNQPGSVNHGKTVLHWAAERGHFEIVLELLEAGIEIDTTTNKLLPIHLACSNGHLKIVTELLKRKPELLNIVDENGNTSLMYAVKDNHLAVSQYLLTQNGIDINAKNQNGQSAIYFASRGKNSEMVEALLKAGVDINQPDRSHEQQLPIHNAVHAANLATVKLLIEYQPEMLNRTTCHGKTPLMIAVCQNNPLMVKYFLSLHNTKTNVLDLDAKTFPDNSGGIYNKTALHYAVDVDSVEIVDLLLKAGASQIQASYGFLPIHLAAHYRSRVIKLLIDAKPEMLNITDDHGNTPLMVATKNTNYTAVIALFKCEEKNNRVNLHAKTHGYSCSSSNGKTALHFAVEFGEEEIIKVLLSSGAGSSFDLTVPLNKTSWFNKMSPAIKDKIKRLEEVNNKKSKSQFSHAFNFYQTSFGDNEQVLRDHLLCSPEGSISFKK